MSMTIALYGLGNMGFPLARRLARGAALRVFDLDRESLARAEADFGAQVIGTPADVTDCPFVVLCLPHPAASLAVLQAVVPHLRPGSVVIETSTVNPEDMVRAARILEGTGVALIDASILAGVSQMEDGSASLLLGGEDEAIAKAAPVLDLITEKRVHFGPLGTGAAAKVINNAVAHAVMVVVAEAGSMATASGVNIDSLIGLLSDAQMGLHRPLTFRYAKRVRQGDYEGGMPLAAARKDSELALALAQAAKVPLFAIQACHTVYEMGVGAGLGREDYAAIAKLWTAWGKPTVPAV
ncbi:MAG: NAD(P)-dependent oxidoreductase [Rhodospirillum sp.]|nr:NAD(P)-dependent oxidoreductase [Rhodospirillum sp.]MCF8490503.1 NAD(P)-dependent oxidoreductase [Rhodospirillum sp.]MCF8500640.1 NAD(P)-dependent oxidoreductase [Rhodospirillum sp.]